jgi:hypothetical protein
MPERDASPELDQLGLLGCQHRRGVDPESVGRAPQQGGVAHRVGGCRQQQELRLARQRPDPIDVRLLDPARQLGRIGQPEPAGELTQSPFAGQLEESERVPPGLGDDPVTHRGVQRAVQLGSKQRTSVAVAQPADHEARQALQLDFTADLAYGKHQRDALPLRHQAAGDERDRLGGDPVQPLRVIDEAEHGLLPGHVAEQGQDREPHQEPIRWRAGSQAERRTERRALGSREELEPMKER